ncbi:putative DNA mismatch repair protein mutl [Patellaria atrata CBS 101060]|uniref:DNA mismatch repair protein mutl n=1 Tax=Patellaria atrata CBS 101060 TaxID=1346257 RepID=A0A9P4S6V6_9PEZI|nr:putative DNA mismatch repair protein mutl [Patellaria atrata CBS 101060]
MPIQVLPRTTVRQIGSSQSISSPTSVVKELIDNALDARATSIFIEIASNTLDTIVVRDNGHDLSTIGGKWLGFRGEALASLAELSGELKILTRVEGEEVAVCLKIGKDGEIQK